MENETGKGGKLETRRNPFHMNGARRHVMPEFALEPTLGLVIDTILHQGCAIIIGATRDGGAVVLTVLDGEQRHRTYCATNEELGAALAALQVTLTE